MKKQQKIAVSYSAFGKKVRKPFKVPYQWDAYENFPEVVAAKATLSEKGHLKAVNAAEQAKARAEALTAAYTAAGYVKETAATSALIRLKDMYKTLRLSINSETGEKYTDSEARALAAKYVGAEWPADETAEEEEEDTEEETEEEEETPAQ